MTSLIVQSSSSSDGPWSYAGAITLSPSNSTIITGLSPSTIYYFRIAGENAMGIGFFSNPSSLSTLPQQPGSPSPSASEMKSGFTNISVKWNAPAWTGSSPITGYELYVSTGLSNPFNLVYQGLQTSTAVTGLIQQTVYR